MKLKCIVLGLLFFLLIGIYWLVKEPSSEQNTEEALTIHCAAGLREPVELLAKEYEQLHGITVLLNYGGSGELLAKLKISGGDLYIPADRSYTQKALEEGLVAEDFPFANLTAGLMVAKENGKNIQSLADLVRPDVRVALADRSAAAGQFTHEVLEQARLLDGIQDGSYVTLPTVNAVAAQVAIGAADVGIVWDSLLDQYPSCIFIKLPEFAEKKTAAIGLIKASKYLEQAAQMSAFLRGERSREVFAQFGFATFEIQ